MKAAVTMKVVVTFKESEEWLYKDIASHTTGKSAYVKEILIHSLRGNEMQRRPQANVSDLSDFGGIVGDDD